MSRQEKWRDIKGYEGHFKISSKGRVKSLKRTIEKNCGMKMKIQERIRKPHFTKDGYLRIRLIVNNKGKNFLIHRLVAMAFIENPENKEEVNHINEIKDDNNVDNLEWVTRNENVEHSDWYLDNMHKANEVRVVVLPPSGKKKSYESIKKMAEQMNIKIPTAHSYVQKSKTLSSGRFEGWLFTYE